MPTEKIQRVTFNLPYTSNRSCLSLDGGSVWIRWWALWRLITASLLLCVPRKLCWLPNPLKAGLGPQSVSDSIPSLYVCTLCGDNTVLLVSYDCTDWHDIGEGKAHGWLKSAELVVGVIASRHFFFYISRQQWYMRHLAISRPYHVQYSYSLTDLGILTSIYFVEKRLQKPLLFIVILLLNMVTVNKTISFTQSTFQQITRHHTAQLLVLLLTDYTSN